MNGGVPITVPSAVRVTSDERSATPQSDTITRPSESTRMFAPLTSRCTMPHAWAYASARAAARSTYKVTGTESAPCSWRMASSDFPSMNFITKNRMPPIWPTRYTGMMLG